MVQSLHNNSKIILHEKHKNGSLHIQKHKKTHVYASPTFLRAQYKNLMVFKSLLNMDLLSLHNQC
jgi:hypothetical protein